MRAVGQADRGRGARDLLHRDAMLEIAEAEAAVFLRRGDRRAGRARPSSATGRAGSGCRGRSRRRAARSRCVGELARRLADRVRGFAEVEVERGGAVGDHGRAVRMANGSLTIGGLEAATGGDRVSAQPNGATGERAMADLSVDYGGERQRNSRSRMRIAHRLRRRALGPSLSCECLAR